MTFPQGERVTWNPGRTMMITERPQPDPGWPCTVACGRPSAVRCEIFGPGGDAVIATVFFCGEHVFNLREAGQWP